MPKLNNFNYEDKYFLSVLSCARYHNIIKLLKAYNNLDKTDILTDESVLMEKMGYKISLVLGDKANFKITTLEDWKRAESYLQ